MPRTFYTERDIEDMSKRGVTEIQVDDSVSITDAAREMMDRLGMKRKVLNGTPASTVLKSPDVANLHNTAPANRPAPASAPAPVTPAPASANNLATKPVPNGALSDSEKQEVIDKVKSGVIARLGAGVDSAVVDQIVRKVVGQL